MQVIKKKEVFVKKNISKDAKQMLSMRKSGISYKKIGDVFGVSGEWVRLALLPPVAMIELTLKCPKCGHVEKGFSKRKCSCIKLGTKYVRPDDVFVNKPSWLREGRDHTRELVRHRDNYTCQTCKKVWVPGMRRFDVHHLHGVCGQKSLSYDHKRDIKNLLTLCHKCHFNHPQHTIKGRKLSTPS